MSFSRYQSFKSVGCIVLSLLALATSGFGGDLLISEVLFNPPGTDVPNEYIELRGTPTATLPAGTYFVAIDGDSAGNPGTIVNVFDLSGRALGANGFLVLLQKGNTYSTDPNATLLVNTGSGAGWGSGATSSIGHTGKSGAIELKMASVTFMLIQSPTPPTVNTDIDSNNDGIPDGPIFAMWTILDSVGILDNDGTGDIAYSAINFRRNPNATASGTIVAVPSFTPSYVARNYNSTGSAAADWVAADSFAGSVPNWVLGNNTVPSGRAHAPLNHIGTTNFGTLPPVVLSELKVNAPGPDDGPYEFIELRGPPNLSLANLWVVAVEGNSSANRGRASMVVDLGASSLGSDGVLIIAAPGNPYTIPAATSVILDSQLANTSGALGNGTISFLLISSTSAISEGADLDGGDNGTLEGLPTGALIVDAVGWSDHDSGDIVYGGVDISQSGFTPDAATRFGSDNTPFSAAAWFSGDLSGGASSLTYNESEVSANFPSGTTLTPGGGNNSVPLISPLQPICGVIGDPTNPQIEFLVGDADTPPGSLTITATSTNPAVVPDSNLLINGSGGTRILTINPIGVGYSQIIITVSDGITTVRRSFPYAASEMGRPGGHFHIGGSDGSTAIAVDANYMFVGDDENQTIRLYHRFRSGLPVWKMDFNPFLGLTDYENGVPREVDIESSTRVGNRIYWMGGHSHANIGEGRTNRTRIFATDISGTGAASTLSYVGRYENLKADLVNWDENNHHGKGANYYGFAASTAEGVEPKAPNGFNIEGLSMMPGSSVGAYIGFRAPIVPVTNRVYALVLPILNFTTMATNSGVPNSSSFGAPIEMDLGGRGVRSIEGVTGNYLIIGGPPGDINPDMPPPRDFKLYTWTGNPADPPQERAADLSGLNPEGIVELPPLPWTDTTQVQLLSDNGRMVYYGDDVTAKHLPITNFKKCRSDMVTLGAVVTPRPTILSITPSGANMMITWRAVLGRSYRVQYSATLTSPTWNNVAGDVTASGVIANKTVPTGGGQRFYRVVLL